MAAASGRNRLRDLGARARQRDRLGALALDQEREADTLEEAIHRGVQLFPQVVRHAAMVIVAVLAPAALRRINRLLDRAHDVGDCHLGRIAGEVIAATRATHALDEAATAKLAEELLEI